MNVPRFCLITFFLVSCDPQPIDSDGDGYDSLVDCDDEDPMVHPERSEVCDEMDNNCDGTIDESSAVDAMNWYRDADEDGFGDLEETLQSCDGIAGYVDRAGDCDDSNGDAYPNAPEDCRDTIDINCDGSVNYIPLPTTCDVHLVQQNVRSTADLSGTGLRVGSVSMSGGFLKGSKGDTVDEFLAYTDTQIEDSYQLFLDRFGPFDNEELIIIDIEYPIHPKDLHTLDEALFEQVVVAFRKRIEVARRLSPDNPISLYGVVVPNAQGNAEAFEKPLEAYQRAGTLGMYDALDFISPILYHRFGDDDPNRAERTEGSFALGLDASSTLQRTDGSSIPLFPLLSFKIANGNSANHGENVTPAHIDEAIELLLTYPSVDGFGFWMPNDENSPIGDIPAFFEKISMVPIPDCDCP